MRGGIPFSDDLSGVSSIGTDSQGRDTVIVHDDAHEERGTLKLADFTSGRLIRTYQFDRPVQDPEDVELDRGERSVVWIADTGDNRGGPTCLRYEVGPDDVCTIAGVDRSRPTKRACQGQPQRVWVRHSVGASRQADYALHRLVAPAVDQTNLTLGVEATLHWSRYPNTDGRCAGVTCGSLCVDPTTYDHGPPELLHGRFDTEAMFTREEVTVDGRRGTSVYLITKDPMPFLTQMPATNGACHLEGESISHVFRIPAASHLRGDVRVDDLLEHVATLTLPESPDATRCSRRVTGATFEDGDLVIITRGGGFRWFVPDSTRVIDREFFDRNVPCRIAMPARADAPKMEGIGLGPLGPDGVRTYYVVSEKGDCGWDGVQSIHRVRERWERPAPRRAASDPPRRRTRAR